jgi:uncharacterized repeat protein (TIGR04138 family)
VALRDDLMGVLARDARYSLDAYEFVILTFDFLRTRQRVSQAQGGRKRTRTSDGPAAPQAEHFSGQELCRGFCDLARREFGGLAAYVVAGWGVRSTSDIGEVVYNLIASGDFEKTPEDARSDFDDVFDLMAALRDQREPGGGAETG